MKKVRVLVVEDSKTMQLFLRNLLEPEDYDVLVASDGEGGIEMFQQAMLENQPFDIVLTDVVMPGEVGGFELARRIREIHPDIPVIYMSGYTGFTTSEMGEVQAPLLQKPTPPFDLALALQASLEKH
jgi:CheY-like chemotaxis protein